MAKKILAAFLAAAMLLGFSGCSTAETVSGWFEQVSDLIPNDIELIIAQLTGMEQEGEPHEIILSEGYVNMLKSGTYYMEYVLADGTTVMYGSNGVRCGSSYPEYNTEPEFDEEGNEIESEVPQEHIVLQDGIYYYIDDNQAKMFTVNPADYKAVPFEISVENIKFYSAGTEIFAGGECRSERYSTDEGYITFYFSNTVFVGMKIEQGETAVLENVTAFNKYLNPALVAMPESYKIVQYWNGE